MGLCVVMNRCAAVEGSAEGGERGKEERKEEDSTQMGEEEQEMDSTGVCCGNCPLRVDDYLLDCSFTTKRLLFDS